MKAEKGEVKDERDYVYFAIVDDEKGRELESGGGEWVDYSLHKTFINSHLTLFDNT